jgi:hypothetical protein
VPLFIGIVALVGFGSLWIATEESVAPASTVSWFVSEAALALAIIVPAVCLYFVIRAVHARRARARENAAPPSAGVRQGSELLWSLSNGLLPQTTSSLNIRTDATELLFLSQPAVLARHRQSTPSTRSLISSARALAHSPQGGSASPHPNRATPAWPALTDVEVAATDRRFLIRSGNETIDLPYADIEAVHLVPGAAVVRIRGGAPMLVLCEHAESIAVLAVWGSAGESALKRHPDFGPLRSS